MQAASDQLLSGSQELYQFGYDGNGIFVGFVPFYLYILIELF